MDPLTYTVRRSSRRRTVSIRINFDRSILILAPAALSDARIGEVVRQKKAWIEKHRNELDRCQYPCQKHNFDHGEIFLFQGRQLVLRHVTGRGGVEVDRQSISVALPPGLKEGRERRCFAREKLQHFFKSKAHEILREKTFYLGKTHSLEPVFVATKDYTSRWGCCFGDGRIYFNWKIIMAPEAIIDYVIIHELCHLRIANHSQEFWRLVARIIPDWRERRTWLRLNGHALIF